MNLFLKGETKWWFYKNWSDGEKKILPSHMHVTKKRRKYCLAVQFEQNFV